MHKHNGIVLFSASDICNFLDCEHLTALDLIDLEAPLPKAEDSEEYILYQKKGLAHEASYLEYIKQTVSSVADISEEKDTIEVAKDKTIEAMYSGVELIYQATFINDCFIGYADFLKKVPSPSVLGDFGYEVIDTKFSRNVKIKYIIQLCFYSELVSQIQQRDPLMMHIVFGDRRQESFRYADLSKYYRVLKEQFTSTVQNKRRKTYPEKCDRCDYCRWRNTCNERWTRDDHLNQVANITRIQIKKLQENGITTLESLARLKSDVIIPKMAPETLARLRHQASLQLKKKQTGKNHYELIPIDEKKVKGLARLPEPDRGDIFFDLEGNPLDEGGLEYLFGVYYFEDNKPFYKSIWAHSQDEEKAAFSQFMDFVSERLRMSPQAHIYHYGHYEKTALKRLMSFYGIQEAKVDNLLRYGRLIDLYKVVREGLRISEPSYSLKNIERFYLDKRAGEVRDAGTGFIYYDKWKETGDPEFLQKIEEYNREDVRSTYELRNWLITLRPVGLPWLSMIENSVRQTNDIAALNEEERRLEIYRKKLMDSLPDDYNRWSSEDYLQKLTYYLLDFHRRAEKPVWWDIFSRREMSTEELIEDAEAIGGMTRDPRYAIQQQGKYFIYKYHYPEQETKLKTGDNCITTDTLERIYDVVIDEENQTVMFSYPVRKGILPEKISIGPGLPVPTKPLKEAIFRFADSLINGKDRYHALKAILKQELPRFKGQKEGTAIIDDSQDLMRQIIEAVAALDNSYIFIQGPPGTGKTYTGSHIIVELLKRGFKVGVSSNSHKAINNLLSKVEQLGLEKGIYIRGAKKSISNDEDTYFNGKMILDVFRNEELVDDHYQIIAGTAWLFADEMLDQKLDFLFVDEAGQVALANLVAMGTSARNIVLLGDQMQLSQPIRGVHPDRTGESSLEYLLNGMATIPSERGIFLNTTWRMHKDVCRFISEAVYDGRLEPDKLNNNQRLILNKRAHPFLKPTGIYFVPVEHDGCSQRSLEEAELINNIYESLLEQRYQDRSGKKWNITHDNILVVTPYNMQVNLLKRMLPKGTRIGTVDKFQGQEAEVVIVSMATSSRDYLPRSIDFLYSKNRLNVALSRAKCLAILVANPALMSIKCNTVEQMALVNTLCWVKEYSERGDMYTH